MQQVVLAFLLLLLSFFSKPISSFSTTESTLKLITNKVCHSQASKKQRIHSYLSQVTTENDGSLFVIFDRPSRCIESFAHGNVLITNSLRFGSITKVFTGYIGIKKAKLNLNFETPISAFGFDEKDYDGSDKVKVLHLYTMQSGIPEYATDEKLMDKTKHGKKNDSASTNWVNGGHFSPQFDVELGWKGHKLDFTPGEFFCYSNTNFELLGLLVKLQTSFPIEHHIEQIFGSKCPSLGLDNGAIPNGGWPTAKGYQNWPFPASLPGTAGSLRGTAIDLVHAFNYIIEDQEIFSQMCDWQSDVQTCCLNPGSSVAAGNVYGFAMQRYDLSPHHSYIGHDGDLICRSIILFDPHSDKIFFYHFTNEKTNSELRQIVNELILISTNVAKL